MRACEQVTAVGAGFLHAQVTMLHEVTKGAMVWFIVVMTYPRCSFTSFRLSSAAFRLTIGLCFLCERLYRNDMWFPDEPVVREYVR